VQDGKKIFLLSRTKKEENKGKSFEAHKKLQSVGKS